MSLTATAPVNKASTNNPAFSMKQLQHVVEDEVLSVFPEFGRHVPRGKAPPLSTSASQKIDPNSVPKVLRRSSSYENIFLGRNERRVCVIYTGGTIGMCRSKIGGGRSNLRSFC